MDNFVGNRFWNDALPHSLTRVDNEVTVLGDKVVRLRQRNLFASPFDFFHVVNACRTTIGRLKHLG